MLAFGAAVAIMLPPTKPIGGAKIISIDNQGFSPVRAAPPPEPAPAYFATTPPMAAQPATTSDDATANAASDEDRDTPNAIGDQAANTPSSPPMRPRRPTMRTDPRDTYAEQDEPDFSGHDYKQGYRWAERADVQSPRDCRVLAGAQIDGCHAYLRDAADHREDRRRDEDDDDRPY